MRLITALLILNLIASKRTNADVQLSCSKKPRRFIATEGSALLGHVFSAHNVYLYPDCHDLCLKAPRCLSYNFEYKSTSSSHVCEINDATEIMCPGSLVRKPGFKYYEEVDAELKHTKPCPPSSPDADETSFQVTFPEQSVTDYIRLDLPSVPPLTALTVCWWLKTVQQSGTGSIFSYSAPGLGNENEILFFHLYTSLKTRIHIAGVHRDTAPFWNLNDDRWHHNCATWENTAGSWNVYTDGALLSNGVDLKTGRVIDNNGIVILGQDQDSHGGGFQQHQSFRGQMYGVNMWNRVLTAQEILQMSKNCSYGVGNYLRWRDFLTADLHGKVYKKSPAGCLP